MAHLISVVATHHGQALAHLKTDGPGGELAGIGQLLGLVDLNGAVVTIDAIGCQKSIAKQIAEAGGGDVLAIKDNLRKLLRILTCAEHIDLSRVLPRAPRRWLDRIRSAPNALKPLNIHPIPA